MIIHYTIPEIWRMADVIVIYVLGYTFPFYPNNPKNKNFQTMKKKCTKNHNHMLYCSWDMVRNRCNYFNFALFFPLSPTEQPKKSKFQKNNKKNTWRYHHFTHVYQKWWLDDVRFLRNSEPQMDGQTDGWTDEKSDIYRWVRYLKKSIFRTECNFLWDTKNKDCKPNSLIQTLVNIYIYIYSLVKYILFQNLSKRKFKTTIAQLSIWKCGLGILYIDPQLNSLELQCI